MQSLLTLFLCCPSEKACQFLQRALKDNILTQEIAVLLIVGISVSITELVYIVDQADTPVLAFSL